MPMSTQERVRKRREAMRAAGLRPVQLWVPDSRAPDFVKECRRQARATAQADAQDAGLDTFLEASLAALDDL